MQKVINEFISYDLLCTIIHEEWAKLLYNEFNKPYMINLLKAIELDRRKGITVYPDKGDIWRIFKYPPNHYKVLILGQDPYINGEADGLAFSSKLNCPPSLSSVIDSVSDTVYLGVDVYNWREYSLLRWQKQGVCLLNKHLTVKAGLSMSHSKYGWSEFTDVVITILNKYCSVALLWGTEAIKAFKLLTIPTITSEHPIAHRYRKDSKWECNNCFVEANKHLTDTQIIW